MRFFVVLSFRGLFMLVFVLGLILLMILSPRAKADVLRGRAWYAAHPAIMRQVLAECRDDPGHIGMSPDCQNARAGEVLEASNMASRVLSPTSAQYWRVHPEWVKPQLQVCSHMRGDEPSYSWCIAARSVGR